MLKLTYMENGFYLERLAGTLEEWVAVRARLAVRSATPLFVEPTTASFLLPVDLPHLNELEALVRREAAASLSFSLGDSDYLEVSLQGTWLTESPESESGVFVATLGDRTEFFLEKLWQEAEAMASVVE